jgi:hypothetical protein
MAESDVCAAPAVQRVEQAADQIKGAPDQDQRHWQQLVQTILQETASMNDSERSAFFSQIDACSAKRRITHPNLPYLEIKPAPPARGPVTTA